MSLIQDLTECLTPVARMLRAGVPDQVMDHFREPFEALEAEILVAPATCAADVLAKLGVWIALVDDPDLLHEHHGPMFRQLCNEIAATI